MKGAKVNVLRLTFKENCGDLRKVIDIIREVQSHGRRDVSVTEPQAVARGAGDEYGVKLHEWKKRPHADALVAAVKHRDFAEMASTVQRQAIGVSAVHRRQCLEGWEVSSVEPVRRLLPQPSRRQRRALATLT